ncbi:sensor histidine kinase [Roseibacillus ishigakijimensis]|uniref:histidine kinase n=1 Tax=Roseibacillus ishigakijimensis TaxID=454146 RepID=A0A934VGV6_9BACT|nr:HAMP domain-containing sensor histidine kinase [Roseibacillus ishigakijimensis]MBK1833283.1 HAMP domain-containing histidine kinase [Roseibacillus ishigakijimensis]
MKRRASHWPSLCLSLQVFVLTFLAFAYYQREESRLQADYERKAYQHGTWLLDLLTGEPGGESIRAGLLGQNRAVTTAVPSCEDLASVWIPLAAQPAETSRQLEADFQATLNLAREEALRALLALRDDPHLAEARTQSGLPLEPLVWHRLMLLAGDSRSRFFGKELVRSLTAQPGELNQRLLNDARPHLPEADFTLASSVISTQITVLNALQKDPPPENGESAWPKEGRFTLRQGNVLQVISLPSLARHVEERVAQSFVGPPPVWQTPQWLAPRLRYREHPLPFPSLGTNTVKELTAEEASQSPLLRNGPFTLNLSLDPGKMQQQIRSELRELLILLTTSCLVITIASFYLFLAWDKQRRLTALQADFVASVSHELRTPIASIGLLAERLEKERLSPGKVAEYHHFIGCEGRRLQVLVENILDFSRLEKGLQHYHREPTDLASLAREAAQLLRPRAQEKGQTLHEEISLPPDYSPLLDGLAIRQLLVNLLDNAVKFTPRKGAIRLHVSSHEHELRLVVSDTGPGIPPSERERVFQRFHRLETNTEKTGAGIGLSLVRHITHAHGGTVRITNNEDSESGTRVEVILPLQLSS